MTKKQLREKRRPMLLRQAWERRERAIESRRRRAEAAWRGRFGTD